MSIMQRFVRGYLVAEHAYLRALVWTMNAIAAGESCRPLRRAALAALDAIGYLTPCISRVVLSLAPPIKSAEPPPKSWTLEEALEAIEAAEREGRAGQ